MICIKIEYIHLYYYIYAILFKENFFFFRKSYLFLIKNLFDSFTCVKNKEIKKV